MPKTPESTLVMFMNANPLTVGLGTLMIGWLHPGMIIRNRRNHPKWYNIHAMVFGLFSHMLIMLAHFLIFGGLFWWLGVILFVPVYAVNQFASFVYHYSHARWCYKLR